MASLRLLSLLLLCSLALTVGTADADAGPLRPPVVWLKGEGNFTKAHRAPHSIDRIVVHVTEGAFWGSVRWLKSPRAHASSHFVVSRRGKVVQLVHLSDIAWHAGNWNVNVRSIGIEHEGFTYGSAGFTDAQYRNSAQLTAWIARRSLMPIDRAHIIGHHEVPGPSGGRGGASRHTDPGPRWNWNRYLALVRSYALPARQKLSVTMQLPSGRLPSGPLRGVVPWRAPTTGGVRRVEFVVDGRVAWTDRQAPFTFRDGRGLNTTRLRNGTHVFELRAYGDGTRHDITRRYVIVANRDFTLTSAGARPWTRVRGTVRLRVRAHGAKAARIVFTVDGRRVALDRTAPFAFQWNAQRARPGKHVLEIVATAADGRVARIRIPLVAGPPAAKPNPAPPTTPTPPRPAPPRLEILSQSLLDGQEVSGFVIWRVETAGRTARVEFLIDGALRGTDVAAPYTLGWSTTGEPPGPHRLTARAVGEDDKTVSATVTVTVPAPPTSGGNEGP